MFPMKNKKREQLGMPFGTAANRLRKMLLFHLAVKLNLATCYRCGKCISSEAELSVEHKDAWLDSKDPVRRFFDMENIGFSHLRCNSGAARRSNKYATEQERIVATRVLDAGYKRRKYTRERRREKYRKTGH